jgi:pre-rRNA-processing protein TSR2
VDAFEEQDPPPDVPYIEETLLQVMSDEFETLLEDGSAEEVAEEVAKDVVQLWDDARNTNVAMVEKWEERAERLKGRNVVIQEVVESDDDESDESGEDEAEDEVPPLLDQRASTGKEPIVDEDGFTLVQGRNRVLRSNNTS